MDLEQLIRLVIIAAIFILPADPESESRSGRSRSAVSSRPAACMSPRRPAAGRRRSPTAEERWPTGSRRCAAASRRSPEAPKKKAPPAPTEPPAPKKPQVARHTEAAPSQTAREYETVRPSYEPPEADELLRDRHVFHEAPERPRRAPRPARAAIDGPAVSALETAAAMAGRDPNIRATRRSRRAGPAVHSRASRAKRMSKEKPRPQRTPPRAEVRRRTSPAAMRKAIILKRDPRAAALPARSPGTRTDHE